MKKEFATALLMLALGAPVAAVPATPRAGSGQKTDQKLTISSVLERTVKGIQEEVVPAAEAMPDDKYNFAPTQGEFKGVRTFAAQVKHMAVANYMLGAAIMGEKKPPVDMGSGEDGPANITSKTDIVKFLKDSFDYLNKAMGTVTESNLVEEIQSPFGSNKTTRLRLILIATSHPFDHYGQMVEYLRMNGIVPPASRK